MSTIVTIKPLSQHFKASQKGRITVYANGLLYYDRPLAANENFYINLPFPARYQFAGYGFEIGAQKDLVILPKTFGLPAPERKRIYRVDSITLDNASKSPARIYTTLNKIVVSPKFYSYSVEVRLFILLHELGHFFYETEWKCDQYAAYHFLYTFNCNPSQGFESLAGVLHTEKPDGSEHEVNNDRIKRIINLLTNKK